MLKTVTAIEKIAGVFLLAVAVLTFVMVILRKFFDTAIPDWYDFSRLVQGVAILWGIGCACYHGTHIQVDLIWEKLRSRGQRRLDLFATALVLLFMLGFAFFALQAAFEMRAANLLTSDLRIPQWGFFLIGALGVAAAAWATIVRLRHLYSGDHQAAPVPGTQTGSPAG
jgi:TRAP-type C4-dicarboxylate transport system permease small subunit